MSSLCACKPTPTVLGGRVYWETKERLGLLELQVHVLHGSAFVGITHAVRSLYDRESATRTWRITIGRPPYEKVADSETETEIMRTWQFIKQNMPYPHGSSKSDQHAYLLYVFSGLSLGKSLDELVATPAPSAVERQYTSAELMASPLRAPGSNSAGVLPAPPSLAAQSGAQYQSVTDWNQTSMAASAASSAAADPNQRWPSERTPTASGDALADGPSPLPRPYSAEVEQRRELTMGQDECAVCLDRPVDTACVPCGHSCLCVECSHLVLAQRDKTSQSALCPICKRAVSDIIKLYKSGVRLM